MVIGLTACGASSSGSTEPEQATQPTQPTQLTEATTTSSSPLGVRELEDGRIEPGRYRHVLAVSCDDPPIPCPDGPPPPLGIDITVPDGWSAAADLHVIHPAVDRNADMSLGTGGPNGAGLILGWATVWVGLNSDPCTPVGLRDGHQIPDIAVGPTVDDFVDAVVAHTTLDVTAPTDATVGGYRARFFTLTAPSDLSHCDNWRPWDPGIYAQGPDNVWDVWAVDVDGLRVVIIAQHFPGTAAEVRTELREMVDSMRFDP